MKIDWEYQYELDHEAWKDSAKEEFYNVCKDIYINLQHHVDGDCKVDVQHAYEVGKAIEKIKAESVDYIFDSEEDGEFGYDFTEEAKMVLSDELGYDWKV